MRRRKIFRARRPGGTATGSTTHLEGGAGDFAKEQALPSTTTENPFANVQLAPKPPSSIQGTTGGFEAKKEEKTEQDGQEKDSVSKDEVEKNKNEKAFGFAAPPMATQGGFGAFSSSKGGLSFGTSTTGGFGAFASSSGASGFAGLSGASAGTSAGTGTGLSFNSSAGLSTAGASTEGSNGLAKEPTKSNVFGGLQPSGTPVFSFGTKPAAKPTLPDEGPVSTGEEDEKTLFSGDGIVYVFHENKQWRQRGTGNIKVNVNEKTGAARIVMRQKGTLRLLMNASLWEAMTVTKMEGGQGVTMALDNRIEEDEGKDGENKKTDEVTADQTEEAPRLLTYAVRIRPPEQLDDFITAIEEHKKGG